MADTDGKQGGTQCWAEHWGNGGETQEGSFTHKPPQIDSTVWSSISLYFAKPK